MRIEGDGDSRRATLIATGEPVEIGPIEKMSKSKRNTVDPDDIMETYGADTARWFMLSDSPPERDVIWTRGRRARRRPFRAAAVAAWSNDAAEIAKSAPAARPAKFQRRRAENAQGRAWRAGESVVRNREAALQRLRRAHL